MTGCFFVSILPKERRFPTEKGGQGGFYNDVCFLLVETGVLDGPLHIIFGRDVVFSADLCYNEADEKPSSERKVAA